MVIIVSARPGRLTLWYEAVLFVLADERKGFAATWPVRYVLRWTWCLIY
jgi:hypothetical protein